MAYSADSFTALEVPTLAKMNKLWSNDASFNDGTGIANNAILTRHIANTQITPDKLNLLPLYSQIDADQSTSATSYSDLATVGPQVAATIGVNGRAIVIFGGGVYTNAVPKYMHYAVTGATARSPDDTKALRVDTAAFNAISTKAELVTGLTPGTNTFTCKYKVASSTGNFFSRYLLVVPL